ncbi:hypothetical protein CHS0354_006672 [Potamilus streckersoni]|uniref:MIT domain-containing protein n=1 Tax=Potamilus streckersoni TaxID=2493646 RepID=A0AAE0W3W0_9BIVA|nr:hypothetical protein CHS0354_006672 [Potamilus streckersoni]
MTDMAAGMLASATTVLKRAVELDMAQKQGEAVVCYQEGLQLLMDAIKNMKDPVKKEACRKKMLEYMDRAEQLKKQVEEEKAAEIYHEQIHIEDNSTGHSYQQLFGRFLDENLTEIDIDDPYVRSTPQIYNLLRFCEMVIKSKAQVKLIRLLTGSENEHGQNMSQKDKLGELARSLKNFKVTLEVSYSDTLHDREIRFNNGWIVKIGRGLDIYKAAEGKFSIGFCDLDLRQCRETTVDIFKSKNVKTS